MSPEEIKMFTTTLLGILERVTVLLHHLQNQEPVLHQNEPSPRAVVPKVALYKKSGDWGKKSPEKTKKYREGSLKYWNSPSGMVRRRKQSQAYRSRDNGDQTPKT